jgi:MarR family transcriptional regulator for hemolysin
MHGELCQTELADKLGIEPHTLAGVVSRMERDGWLLRTPCADDRRKQSIAPTPRAEVIWARAAGLCRDVRRQAVEGCSEEDIQTFRKVCQQIQRNLAETEDAQEPLLNTTESGEIALVSASAPLVH